MILQNSVEPQETIGQDIPTYLRVVKDLTQQHGLAS